MLSSLRIASVRAAKGSVLVDFSDFLSTDVGDIGSALRMSLGGFYRIEDEHFTFFSARKGHTLPLEAAE